MNALTLANLGRIHDGPHATPQRRSEGPYFLNISSLSRGRLDLSQSDHVDDDDFATWTRRVEPQVGDLLFSYETRLGEAALMPEGIRACLGRRMALLRPDTSMVDPRFLLYYYLSPEFQRTIHSRSIHGATVSRIPLNTMGGWPVVVPDIRRQQAIAAVLGALDDKIAANTAVAETADALSEARFATLEKPTVTPLTEVARFINGKAFTKDASGSGRVVIRIAELNSGIGNSTVYSDIEVANDYTARPGDLLFAWSGSLTVNRWYRPEAIINQHIFKVVPRDGHPAWLANQALRSRLSEFKSIASDKATTMGHIQRRHLEEFVALPSNDAIVRESELMDGLWRIALAAEMENLTLAGLRDTLLPALMSGILRVKDAELQVEDAV